MSFGNFNAVIISSRREVKAWDVPFSPQKFYLKVQVVYYWQVVAFASLKYNFFMDAQVIKIIKYILIVSYFYFIRLIL